MHRGPVPPGALHPPRAAHAAADRLRGGWVGAPSAGAGVGHSFPHPLSVVARERLAVWLWFAQVDTKVFVDVDAKKVGNLIGPKGATLHKIQVGLAYRRSQQL